MQRGMWSALAQEDQEEAMRGAAAREGGGDNGAGSQRSGDNRDGGHVLGAHGEDGGPGPQAGEQGQEGLGRPGLGGLRQRARHPALSARQLQALESVFLATPYPTTRLRQQLAGVLNVTEGRVQSWFKQRRAKWRRRQRASMMRNVPPMAQDHPVILNMGRPCNAIYFQHLNCIWPVLGAPPPVVLLPQPPQPLPGHQPAARPQPPHGPQPPFGPQHPPGPQPSHRPQPPLGPQPLPRPQQPPLQNLYQPPFLFMPPPFIILPCWIPCSNPTCTLPRCAPPPPNMAWYFTANGPVIAPFF